MSNPCYYLFVSLQDEFADWVDDNLAKPEWSDGYLIVERRFAPSFFIACIDSGFKLGEHFAIRQEDCKEILLTLTNAMANR